MGETNWNWSDFKWFNQEKWCSPCFSSQFLSVDLLVKHVGFFQRQSHGTEVMKSVDVGGWAYPSEKWWSSSVGILTFPIYGEKKHVPNHQSVTVGWVNISIRWLSCTFRGSHELKFHMESRHIIVSQHSPGSGSIQKRETKTIQNGCYWEEFIPSGRLKF